MDILEAIRTRKSIRGFKPDPIPRGVIRDILDTARYTPSSVNSQPWQIYVLAGNVLDDVRKGNVELFRSGAKPNPEVPLISYEGKYKERQVEAALRLFKLMDIGREDRQKRFEFDQRGLRFFDAPLGIMIAADKSIIELHSQFDIGMMTFGICLTALAHGLGACIENQGIMFPEVVRRFVPVPDSSRLVSCIALGYPDWDFPGNQGKTSRLPLDGFVTWCGFD